LLSEAIVAKDCESEQQYEYEKCMSSKRHRFLLVMPLVSGTIWVNAERVTLPCNGVKENDAAMNREQLEWIS
jgi:hypothetical protein